MNVRTSMRWLFAAVIGTATLSVAGCGGGGGGGGDSPSPPHFTVGGTVSGLPADTSMILQNNDGDSITVASNSSFTFPTVIATGGAFSVTIATQIAGLTCAVNGGTGTVAAANVTTVLITCVPATYTIGGIVSGLAPGTSLVLNDNGGDPLTVGANAVFTFAAPITAGDTYRVTVVKQPTEQTCLVSGGAGTATDSNVTAVRVTCARTTYTISGIVTGLGGGTAVVLQNNGADSVSISINTRFTFATAIPNGGKYDVTIGTQPLYQSCTVNGGSGMVAGAAVTDVVVHCPYVEFLWSFGYGLDGEYPQAGLIRASDGNFYGTTAFGGPNLWGSVFKYTPTGMESLLTSFASGADGERPLAALLQASDGNFYGTTYAGGANSLGTVFRVTPSGSSTVLWSFGAGTDGQLPKGSLVQALDGALYGTTSGGGTLGGGTVFKITLAGAESIVWNFGSGSDGTDPEAAVIQGSDGNFYGTTALGGTQNQGTVFKLTPSGVETVLWNFDYISGSGPNSRLIQASDGNFYGTTVGTVFKITPAGVESTLWSFGTGSDGYHPMEASCKAVTAIFMAARRRAEKSPTRAQYFASRRPGLDGSLDSGMAAMAVFQRCRA